MIRFAEEGMRGDVRALWQDCFGDGGEYVDLFLSSHDLSRHTMVFVDGARLAAMLTLLPMTVVTAAGIMPARYIYAVATREDCRGKGISTRMLEAAHRHMKESGVKLSVLVPATADLYNFYQKRGYDTAFYSGHGYVPADQIPTFGGTFAVTETSPQEFMQIRERAFAGRTMFVRWDGDALAYRMAETSFTGGETLTLTVNGAQAVAVCHNQGGIVTLKELALDGMDLVMALAVLQEKYHADAYRLRLPMDVSCPYPLKRVASGAACWYDQQARERVQQMQKAQDAYISLVLD